MKITLSILSMMLCPEMEIQDIGQMGIGTMELRLLYEANTAGEESGLSFMNFAKTYVGV